MNSKRIVKVIFSAICTFACLFIFQTMCQAASFSASISKTTVTVGDTFTVTVKANNAAGMYSVSNSNSNVSLSSGSKSEFLENGSATVKFKAVKEGTVKITAKSVDMTDLDNSNKSVTGTKTFNVKVKAKLSSSNSGESSSSSSSTAKPTFTSKNQTVYATSQVNVRSNYSTSSSILGVLKKGDSVTRTGIATKSVNGILWSKVTYNGRTGYITSGSLTTTKPTDADEEKEDDKDGSKATSTNLKSLAVIPTGLSPVFSSGTTEYTMTVGANTNEINVEATPEDENASVKVTGNTDLKIGTNKISIIVTAGKETKTYNITVTKEETNQLQLAELLIEGLPLQPQFDSDIYEYTLTLDRSDLTELNITATPTDEKAEVEIVGDADLKPGENVVTILVKSEDEEDITTYQITVTIPEGAATIEDTNKNDLYLYIGIGVGAFLLLLIIIIVIVRKSHNRKEENMYYGMYNPNGNDDEKENKNLEEVDKDSKKEASQLDELPKLNNEDLPKSLRKNSLREQDDFWGEVKEEKRIETIADEEPEIKSKKSKEIEKFYNAEDDERPRKKGKHSK